MSDIDTAYIAGIMDGEGCITVNKKQPKAHHNPTYGLCVSVTNTNLDLLIWVGRVTGLGHITPKPKPKNPTWKLCYQWNLDVHEITPFLTRVMPYMRVRNRQAKLANEFIETTKYHGPNRPLTVAESVERELIYEELAVLNKRGDNGDRAT